MSATPAAPRPAPVPGPGDPLPRVYAGVDLAADPMRTGVAFVRQERGGVSVDHVSVGADDDAVLAAVRDADRAGIDVPFGWPDPFVALVSAHASGTTDPPANTAPEWRRAMAQRLTDLHVRARTGLTPLSVSTDRIAYPALRWAAIEARLRHEGIPVPRGGSGGVCEVYPAAALRRWGLPYRGYKSSKNAAARHSLVRDLTAVLPWLEWNGADAVCRADDNALDAVIAALVAREVDLGGCEPPPPEAADTVAREGWVWIPRGAPSAP